MNRGLRFEVIPRAAGSSARRADVALFVGFAVGPATPIVVESADAAVGALQRFVTGPDGLAWEAPLVSAILDFFANGGRRAWVLALPPIPRPSALVDVPAWRRSALDALVPGLDPAGRYLDPRARETWRGLGHLASLGEVSFALIPDLPHLLVDDPVVEDPAPPEVQFVPAFAECSELPPEPPLGRLRRRPAAPEVDDPALTTWIAVVRQARTLLERLGRNEVQLLLALPLGREGTGLHADPLLALDAEGAWRSWRDGGIASAAIQLAHPWFDGAAERPGAVSPPDGVLAGLLAHNALSRGTFRTAARVRAPAGTALTPRLRPRAYATAVPIVPGAAELLNLAERVCLFTPEVGGVALSSDVTTAGDRMWRHGGVSRLAGVVRRLLLEAGEDLVFEPNHPDTRRALERELTATLEEIEANGGIAEGADGTPAFRVRCDATTNREADVDGGRLVAEVEVRPVAAIEAIHVVLTLGDGQLRVSEAA